MSQIDLESRMRISRFKLGISKVSLMARKLMLRDFNVTSKMKSKSMKSTTSSWSNSSLIIKRRTNTYRNFKKVFIFMKKT